MIRKMLKINELEPGMYVEDLDRPWLETPYPLQGILIESQEDISELARFCQSVYVSLPDDFNTTAPNFVFPVNVNTSEDDEKTIFHGDFVYSDAITVHEELPAAKVAYEKAHLLIEQIKKEIELDSALNTDTAKKLVDVITTSVVNNPNALLLLNSFKSSSKTKEAYERALSVAIYMIAFGRHLCLPKEELAILGLGGLLMDIGHIQLISNSTDEITVSKNSKTEAHVLYGQQILSNLNEIPEEVLEITMQHHEREDGSGYPNGLGSNRIGPYARMAAIVDCYVDLISQDTPKSPFQALSVLGDWSRNWLNATLVNRFAHSIGLFPVGSLVELKSAEVAIVLSHNRVDRLKPLIMILLDANKKPYSTPKTVDLSLEDDESYKITGDIKPNTYDIDAQKYYL